MRNINYLFVLEDGEIKAGNTFSDKDKEEFAIGCGILAVIRLVPLGEWYGGEWHKIEEVEGW